MIAGPMIVGRALGAASRVTDAALGRRLSILIFHRVLAQADPLFPDEVDAQRFEQLMTLVKAGFNVVTTGQALAHLKDGSLPPRALVITFDDGYADNAEVALPILQRHGLKATFFVASSYLDGGRMFNDTVIESLRACRLASLDLSAFGLGSIALDSSGARRAAIDLLLPKVKYLSLDQRQAFLDQLATATGDPALPSNLMMKSGQVVALHRAGMEVGAHTARHPILRVTPDAQAEADIAEGREVLQQLIGAPVDVFAYPNGRPMQDYDARHVAMVRRQGFRGAVTTAPGVAASGSDPLQLPRFTPWDRNVSKWAARLMKLRLTGGKFQLADLQ